MLHRIEISTGSTGNWESSSEKKLKRETLSFIAARAEIHGIDLVRVQFVKPPKR